jgi:hypothetical protein
VLEPLHPGTSPRCYLLVHTPTDPPGLIVAILSEDLREFKVAVVWERPFDGGYAPCRLGKHTATIIKARVSRLFLAREVHVLDDANHGFVTLLPTDGVGPLANTVDKALRAVSAIGDLVA